MLDIADLSLPRLTHCAIYVMSTACWVWENSFWVAKTEFCWSSFGNVKNSLQYEAARVTDGIKNRVETFVYRRCTTVVASDEIRREEFPRKWLKAVRKVSAARITLMARNWTAVATQGTV